MLNKTPDACWKAILCLFSLACFMACATNNKQQLIIAEASKNLGEAYLAQGDLTLALQEFIKAEAINPDDAFLQNDLGLAYMGKERFDQAIKHFKRAIKLNPDYSPPRNNLGIVYLAKEEWDEAIECFNSVTHDIFYATPHFPLSNLGWAYFHKKDYVAAETYYKKALDLEPKFVKALYGLGITYMAMDKTEAAIGQFEKALVIAPNSPELLYEAGIAYQTHAQTEEASNTFRKIIALEPDSALAENAKKRIRQMGGSL